MVIGGVKCAHGVSVEHPPGQGEGHDRAAFRVPGAGLRGGGAGGMIAPKEDAAGSPAGETIEPGDGVFELVVALAAHGEKCVEGIEGNGFGVNPWANDRFQLNVSPGDHAGEAQAADGCAEHVGIFRGTAEDQAVIGAMEAQLADVGSEGSGAVMVLAVDVIGDGAADGDKASPGGYGEKPASGYNKFEYLGKTDAGLATDHAEGWVKAQDAVEAARIDEVASGIETGIAITAAESVRKKSARGTVVENGRYLIIPGGLVNKVMRDLWVPSPREDAFDRGRDRGLFAQSYGRLTRHNELKTSERDLPVDVDHACRDHKRRCTRDGVTDRIADRERDRVFLEFSAMREKPSPAEPIENDWAKQQ